MSGIQFESHHLQESIDTSPLGMLTRICILYVVMFLEFDSAGIRCSLSKHPNSISQTTSSKIFLYLQNQTLSSSVIELLAQSRRKEHPSIEETVIILFLIVMKTLLDTHQRNRCLSISIIKECYSTHM